MDSSLDHLADSDGGILIVLVNGYPFGQQDTLKVSDDRFCGHS
jgi:hypothetical protein